MEISTLSGTHSCMVFQPRYLAQGYHEDRTTLSYARMNIVVPLSLSACRTESIKTRWLSWGPSGFFNLNNCSHLKLEGSILDLTSMQGVAWTPLGTAGQSPWFQQFTVSGLTGNMVVPSGQNMTGCFPFYEKKPVDDSIWSYEIRWRDAYTMFFAWTQAYPSITRGETDMVVFNKTFTKYSQLSSGRIDLSKGESASEMIDRYFNVWLSDPKKAVSGSNVTFGNAVSLRESVRHYLTVVNGSLADKLIPREPPSDSVWQELAYQTIVQYDTVDVNGIAFAADLVKIKQMVSALKILVDVTQGEINPKKLAKLFLAWHYGARLTIRDTAEILSARRSWSWQHRYETQKRAASSDVIDAYGNTLTTRYAMYAPLIDKNYDKLSQYLHAFDLDVTLENLWDLIPFSFVLDWIVNVSDCLDRIDHIYMLKTLSVKCVGFSTKYQKRFDTSVFGSHVQGGAIVVKYDRWYRKEPVYPRVLLSQATSPTRHVLEGSALIISSI